MITNWTLKNGSQSVEHTSFPYAFRAMFFLAKGTETIKPVNQNDLTILGPKDPRGDRRVYSYFSASQLAREQGLLTSEGTINSKEFKKK